MKEYNLYVPCHSKNGGAIEPERILRLKEQLADEFGGFTEFPQRMKGAWKVGGVSFLGNILVFRVLAKKKQARPFFARLKGQWKGEYPEDDLLIIEKDAQPLEGGLKGERI
jgi:hypothetical protein